MKEYTLKYSEAAANDLGRLASFATQMHTLDFAKRYVAQLRNEIEQLSYLADALPQSRYELPLAYHHDAKTLIVGNRKLTVIFHTDNENVLIDKIIPSAMITH